MNQEIKSTVIIPNYNGMKYIEDCLKALAGEPAHIIVVDNGSSDGSRELVESKFPQVELLCLERNHGFCKAVNLGIRKSDTKYVILLNNDTKAKRGFVRALETPLDRDGNIFSGSAQMRSLRHPELIDDAGDYYCALGWAFSNGKDRPVEDYRKSYSVFSACGGASIFRREIFSSIGYLDEAHFAYLEDVDLGYRARIYGYKNIYVPEAVVYHAGSGFSGSRYNEFKIGLSSRNSVYLVYKNMPFLQLLLNLPFLLAGFSIKTLFFAKKGFGKVYLKGIGKGIGMCVSGAGRAGKVRFRTENFHNYVKIQLELWRNIWYRIR